MAYHSWKMVQGGVVRISVYRRASTERQTTFRTHIHAYGQFTISSSSHTMPVFVLWEGAGVYRENLRRNENMQTQHRAGSASSSCCEVTVLLCCSGAATSQLVYIYSSP